MPCSQFYHPGRGLLVLPTLVRPRLWRELAGWLEGGLQQGVAFELRFPRRFARSRPRAVQPAPATPCCSGSLTGRWPSFAQAAATGTG